MPIYRGSGGSGNSSTSANANQVAIDSAAAAQSAIDAAASAAAALVSENEAESAETNAETSETNASTSASNAATSETNAATSATNAATSATNAGTSETNAATSASNASTSETNAASSASSASTSASNAASSESTATTKAAEASTSATNASNSATASANSATASANSATASAASAAAAQAAQEAIDGLYLGAQASDPTLDLNGDPVTVGDWYFNTVISLSKIYTGSSWEVLTATGSVTSVTGTGTVNGVTLTGTVTSSGDLTLGGTLSGITALQLNSQNISQWTNDSGYLTSYAETDTLDSVTGRGATTTNAVTVGNLTSTGIDDNATETAITIDTDERVGINITPTNRTFEVNAKNGAQIISTFETTSTIAGRIGVSDANTTADSSVGIGSTGDNLDLYAGAAARATLNSAGKLIVTGDLSATAGIFLGNVTSTGDFRNMSGRFERIDIGAGFDIDSFGTINFDYDTNHNDNRKANFGTGDDLQIYHDGSNSYIEQSGVGNLIIDASVGIGATPNALLDVSSATTSTIRLSNSDTSLSANQITGQVEFYQADSTLNGTGVTGKIGMRSVTQTGGGSYFGNVADMAFHVSGQANGYASDNATLNALTIQGGTGNVGIGSTPRNKLQVTAGGVNNAPSLGSIDANAQLYLTNNDSNYGLVVGNNSADGHVWMQAQRTDGTATAYNITLNEAGGNVGIGDINPSNLLSLKSGTQFKGLQIKNGAGGLIAELLGFASGNDAGGLKLWNGGAAKVQIISTGPSYLTGGNVAIGTTSTTKGRLIAEGVSPATGTNTLALVSAAGSSKKSGISLYGTFVSPTADQTARRVADITAGFSTANWATEYLAFHVGTGASNDTQAVTTERMRIDGAGNLLVGTTNLNPHTSSTPADSGLSVNPDGIVKVGRNEAASLLLNRMTTTGLLAKWFFNGVQVGNISVTATSTAYNTSSDQRLKDNIVDAPSASNDIDAIQVRSFDWKVDGSHQTYGMVAQELVEVAPEAVSQGETDEDMWSVDYSKLVPMMIKEIQDLRARVAELQGAN